MLAPSEADRVDSRPGPRQCPWRRLDPTGRCRCRRPSMRGRCPDAIDQIRALAAQDAIVAVAAEQGVVAAVAAVQRELRQCCDPVACRDRVIAVLVATSRFSTAPEFSSTLPGDDVATNAPFGSGELIRRDGAGVVRGIRPGPPSKSMSRRDARPDRGGHRVVAVDPWTATASVDSSTVTRVTAASPSTARPPPPLLRLQLVRAARRIDDHGVGRAVGSGAAGREAEIRIDLRDACRGEVIDGPPSRSPTTFSVTSSIPAASMVIAADARVSRDLDPFAEKLDAFVDIRPVEPDRVGAGLALDRVAVVAGIHWWSLPPPSSAVSRPMFPSTTSLPAPPISVSFPGPPRMV